MDMDNQQERSAASFDLGWVVGIFEGEGSVSLAWARNGEQILPVISIANTDPNIIEACVQILNAHQVPTYVHWNQKVGKVKITGAKRVLKFIELVEPAVKGNKQTQLHITQRWIQSRLGHEFVREPYTQFEWWLFKRLRDIHGKGRAEHIDRKVAEILRDYTPNPQDLPPGVKI